MVKKNDIFVVFLINSFFLIERQIKSIKRTIRKRMRKYEINYSLVFFYLILFYYGV